MTSLVGPELDPEPESLEGDAKGAEMHPGPLGVSGGVGLPGTGLCWKLDMFAPRGDTEGTSVLTVVPRPGNSPGPQCMAPLGGKGPGGPLGLSPGDMEDMGTWPPPWGKF